MTIYLKGVSIEDTPFLFNYLYVKILYNMNKVITTQGNVQFQFPDGKIVNVHPNHIYTVFSLNTVSFILVGLPKTSGLSTMTSKAEDLELNGTVYSFAELPNAISEAFAIAGAQARCEIVDELPETGYTNTIYLVPQPAPQTGFDEYVYILDQGWELIGDTSIEMDNYVLKTVFSGYTADTAVVLEGLRTDIDTTSGNVITETERALLAESGLSDAIDAEETAREAADTFISGAVDSVSSGLTEEVERALNAESGLSDAIVAEIARAEEAESGLSNSITAEENRAKAVESGLSESIDAEETRALGAESNLADAISAETSAREAADGVISGAVDTVSSGLTQEAERAIAAESGLSDAIDAEETRALAAEEALDDKIDAVSGAVDTKLAINDFNVYSGNVDTAINSKASQSDLNALSDTVTAHTADTSIHMTSGNVQNQIDSSISGKANSSDVYLKSETSGATEIATALNEKQDSSKLPNAIVEDINFGETTVSYKVKYKTNGGEVHYTNNVITINNQKLFNNTNYSNLNLVETSAITTSVTSASTDSEIPSAKAMYDELAAIDVKFIDDARYELSGSTHVINFYNGDVVKATIDCSDFIIDGMVDNVYIENGYLVIDFNTESGKQDIQIPLTDIFNPNNYYTKSETSGATELSTEFVTKLNTADFNTYSGSVDTRLAEDEEVTSRALNALNETVSGKVSTSDFEVYSGAVETALNGKANSSDVYLKSETSGATEISTALSNKLDATAYTPTDLSNYYTKSETSGSTEIATALSGKQDTLSAGTNITISGNVISAEGGGKAVSAGTNISITTGETVDTINCTLPITANTATIKSISIGQHPSLSNQCDGSIVVGYNCSLSNIGADGAAAMGWFCKANRDFSFAQGHNINANNYAEHSVGEYNVSNSGSSTSAQTLFSVGNGTSDSARHNAFEIRHNGDIYFEKNGSDVKLQDVIPTTTSAVTSGSTDAIESGAVYDQMGGMKIVKLTESEYAALVTKDSNTLYVVIPDPTNP